jgi:hypothetical protein
MSRREQLWISLDVCRSLWILAKTRGHRTDEQGFANAITADELADEMLRDVIKERFPQLSEHRKAVAKLEKELIQTLGGGRK